jgi:hypothetical protein
VAATIVKVSRPIADARILHGFFGCVSFRHCAPVPLLNICVRNERVDEFWDADSEGTRLPASRVETVD